MRGEKCELGGENVSPDFFIILPEAGFTGYFICC